MASTTLKAVYDTEIRRLAVNLNSEDVDPFTKLLSDLASKFEIPQSNLELRYQDDESELVTIKSTDELKEAFATAQADGKTLKVYIHGPSSSGTAVRTASFGSSSADTVVPLTSEALEKHQEQKQQDDKLLTDEKAEAEEKTEAVKDLMDSNPIDNASVSDADSFVQVEAPEDSTDILRASLEDVAQKDAAEPEAQDGDSVADEEEDQTSPDPTEDVKRSLHDMERKMDELGLDAVDLATEDDDDSVFSFAVTIKSLAVSEDVPSQAPPPEEVEVEVEKIEADVEAPSPSQPEPEPQVEPELKTEVQSAVVSEPAPPQKEEEKVLEPDPVDAQPKDEVEELVVADKEEPEKVEPQPRLKKEEKEANKQKDPSDEEEDPTSLPSMEALMCMIFDLLSQHPLRGALQEGAVQASRLLEAGNSNLLQIINLVLEQQPELSNSVLIQRLRDFIPSLLVSANKVFKVSRKQTVNFLKVSLPTYLARLDAGEELDASQAPLDFVFGDKCLLKLRNKWLVDNKKEPKEKKEEKKDEEEIKDKDKAVSSPAPSPVPAPEPVAESQEEPSPTEIKPESKKEERILEVKKEKEEDVWITIAHEDEVIQLAPNTRVRYGQGDKWVEAIVGGEVQVNNAAFSDPVPGVRKELQMYGLQVDAPVEPSDDKVMPSHDVEENKASQPAATEPVAAPAPEPIPSAEAEEKQEQVLHVGVKCDGCGVAPIPGIRYKCVECHDYDLCENCELSGKVHNSAHIMYKIKVPTNAEALPFQPPRFPSRQSSGAQPQPRPSGFQSKFVLHVNLPNNTVIAPGSVVTKTWRVQNTGNTVWPHGVKLVCVSGEVLPFGDVSERIPIPRAAPGETIQISLKVAIPQKPGRYCGNYKLETSAGVRFGERIWVVVEAQPPYCYAEALQALVHMGFENEASNKKALEKVKGNVQEAVEDLVRNS